MDDVAAIASAVSDLGTVGILVAFIYAVWKDHQLQQERIYQITLKLVEKVLDDELRGSSG